MNYIVTGSRMHNRGWRSVYCVTKRDAFRGTAPINLTDRLHQVLRWATGSVEIFSRNNALFASRRMKFLQRVAYFNVGMYPFTSLFLIVYCFLPAVSLFTGQFIVQTLSVTFLVFLLMITLTLCFLAILEIKWSGITLHDWWRNEQFWLIGGTSAHPAAVMQGLLKVLRGGPCECGFKICRECYLDCVGSGGGHCPGCKEPYKECALCWTEVVTRSVTFNSPRGSRGLIQMIDLGLWRVCKALLAEYIAVQKRNRPFKGLGLEHMNKSCPVVPSQLTSTSLRSSQFQTDIFCLRERDLLINFAAEISQLQAQGLSREYALLQSYQFAKDLGRAFSDRAILQTFLDAEAAVSSGPLKSMLSLLRSMHVLIILEDDASFLRYGYLSPDNAVGIRKEVTILYSELRPHALALVSSFGIPDAFLSHFAFNWIDANSWSLVQPQQGGHSSSLDLDELKLILPVAF